jgi:hypothetical protein
MNRCSGNEEPSVGDEAFTHDVFLSHSAKDKAVVRAVAERLRSDGLRVWFEQWELKPEVPLAHRMGEGAGVRAAKIEEGLEHSKLGTRNAELRSPACRRMRSARTGRSWRPARVKGATCPLTTR